MLCSALGLWRCTHRPSDSLRPAGRAACGCPACSPSAKRAEDATRACVHGCVLFQLLTRAAAVAVCSGGGWHAMPWHMPRRVALLPFLLVFFFPPYVRARSRRDLGGLGVARARSNAPCRRAGWRAPRGSEAVRGRARRPGGCSDGRRAPRACGAGRRRGLSCVLSVRGAGAGGRQVVVSEANDRPML